MQNCVSLTSAFERSYDLSLLTPMCQCERSSDITIITSTTDPCLHTLSFTRCTKTAALAITMSVPGQVTHKVIRNALWKNQTHKALFLLGCVPFSESKNGFLILDLPDFSVERNVKSEIGFVTLVTFRQRVQYARQPLKK